MIEEKLQLAAKEQLERMAVVALAKTWLGTPYRSSGQKRGSNGGVDCANLPAAVYPEAGVVPAFPVEFYPQDWHLHRSAERYLAQVLKFATELPEGELPKPGDMVVWKFGRCFSHGAIVVEWPRVIHAFIGGPCRFADAEKEHILKFVGEAGPEHGKPRERKFFTLWAG
jgi:cell wall-associated NlpC family hydrolase